MSDPSSRQPEAHTTRLPNKPLCDRPPPAPGPTPKPNPPSAQSRTKSTPAQKGELVSFGEGGGAGTPVSFDPEAVLGGTK